MRRSISKAFIEYAFSQTTISRMHRKYQVPGKTLNIRQRCGWKKKALKCKDRRRLTRIIQRDRHATISQYNVDVSAGASTSFSVWFVQQAVIHLVFRASSLLVYRCWLHGTKLDASHEPVNTSTGLLMTSYRLPVWSRTRTPIHVHCAFGRTWIILSAQCHTPHDESWHRGAPRAFSWL